MYVHRPRSPATRLTLPDERASENERQLLVMIEEGRGICRASDHPSTAAGYFAIYASSMDMASEPASIIKQNRGRGPREGSSNAMAAGLMPQRKFKSRLWPVCLVVGFNSDSGLP